MNAPARTALGSGLVLLPIEVDDLVERIADRVVERIPRVEPGPVVVDRRGLGVALGVGLDTVDKLRSQGCPELKVGDSPRFEVERVLEWLRGRAGK